MLKCVGLLNVGDKQIILSSKVRFNDMPLQRSKSPQNPDLPRSLLVSCSEACLGCPPRQMAVGLQECDAGAILGAADTVVLVGRQPGVALPAHQGSTLQMDRELQPGGEC